MKKNIEQLFKITIPLLFTFPLFKESISTFLLLLLFANSIAFLISNAKIVYNIKKTYILLSIPFWIIFITSLIRFKNLDSLKPVNIALFFLLFPLAFSFIPSKFFSNEKLYLYFNILKNSCLTIALGYVILFFQNHSIEDFFIITHNVSVFRNFVYNETKVFGIHPTYYTSFVIFCIAFCFENLINKKKWIEIIYITVFVMITFLVIAKINIIFLCFLLPTLLFFRLKSSFKIKTLFSLILIGAFGFLVVYTPGVTSRFNEMVLRLNSPPKDLAYDSTNIRVALNTCNLEIIKENYLFGVGFSSLKNEMCNCLKQNFDTSFFVGESYLTHNYYFYILISSGIMGFTLFLFYIFKIVITSLKINKFILYAFLSNVAIICFVEDYFVRSYGIFYFNLMLFTFIKNKEHTDFENKDSI